MPSAVADYLSELTLRLDAQLDRRLAGAWPIGSGALGDFDTIAQRRGRAGRVHHAGEVTGGGGRLRYPSAHTGGCSLPEVRGDGWALPA
jgi:hypothetical protein